MRTRATTPANTCNPTASRRQFLRAGLVGAAALLPQHAARGGPTANARPNILIAVTDNQSWEHCSAMGGPVVRTPAFDRVAAAGLLCRHAFAPCPSCTPSRSAILTGQDMWRLEEAGLLHGGFPATLPVYTEALADAGYHVGYTGKGWGPGRWDSHGRERDPAGVAYNSLRERTAPRGIARLDYAGNFDAFLQERETDQPFCFWFGAREPHRPFPEDLGDEASRAHVRVPAFLPDVETVRRDFLDYYTEVEWQDRHLGRMLDRLEAMGELDNTLVVVTSDNGIQMPRGITTLYDHGTRVPLAICWGNRLQGGQTSDAFVNLTDLAPTFLEVAGLAAPDTMTGRSLLALLYGAEDAAQRDAVFTGIERHTVCRPGELPYPSRAIRTPDYLYIRNYEPDRWPAGAPDYPAPAQGIYGDVDRGPTKAWMLAHQEDPAVAPKFALCFGKRPAEELYHVPSDPDQVRNLAGHAEHETVRVRLSQRLAAHLARTGDPRAEGRSPWDHYPYHSLELHGFRDQLTNPHVFPPR